MAKRSLLSRCPSYKVDYDSFLKGETSQNRIVFICVKVNKKSTVA